MQSKGYAAISGNAKLEPYTFERRDLGAHDVALDIAYGGICHSDIHQVREEWGSSLFPMVPGHEIVGRVTSIGSSVSKFAIGDLPHSPPLCGCNTAVRRPAAPLILQESQPCNLHFSS